MFGKEQKHDPSCSQQVKAFRKGEWSIKHYAPCSWPKAWHLKSPLGMLNPDKNSAFHSGPKTLKEYDRQLAHCLHNLNRQTGRTWLAAAHAWVNHGKLLSQTGGAHPPENGSIHGTRGLRSEAHRGKEHHPGTVAQRVTFNSITMTTRVDILSIKQEGSLQLD